MKVAIYCRVSTEDQTIEQQKEPLIKICTEKQFEYVIFEEKISGAKESRPQLDLMLQRIRQREFQAIMVYKLDRLGRSLKHLIQLIEEFNNKNIQFICLSPDVDTRTSTGMFFIQIIGAVAELEREMIRERTKTKLDSLKRKGIILGRPKGSKDKGERRKSGYHLRWVNTKSKK